MRRNDLLPDQSLAYAGIRLGTYIADKRDFLLFEEASYVDLLWFPCL
jgi:hypothetical protein